MFVYMLKCENNSLYTGIAANPERRLRQHLGIIKGGAKYTRCHKVIKVMAIWEDKTGEYARKLEYFLKKKLSRQQKLMILDNPHISLSKLETEIPEDVFTYVSPDELNKKYF